MNILALDTSSQAASCAILRGGNLAGEYYCNVGFTHSQTAMPMVESLLETAGMTAADLDVLAVTVGPGSFTGLRIGIASVKGMALALNRPCAGVSTLQVLAWALPWFQGYVASVMDARRDQFYTALFRSGNGTPERMTQDAALSFEELRAVLAPLDAPVMLVGDGAQRCHELMGSSKVMLAPERYRHQRASCLAAAAAELVARNQLVTADELAPSYLRLPQAERERMEREQSGNIQLQ